MQICMIDGGASRSWTAFCWTIGVLLMLALDWADIRPLAEPSFSPAQATEKIIARRE